MSDDRPGSRSTTLWICPSCRRGNVGEACSFCSAPQQSELPASVPVDGMLSAGTGPAGRFSPRVMVALGVLVLVVLVAGALALVNRHGSGRSVSASGPTQSAPTSAPSPVPAKPAGGQGP